MTDKNTNCTYAWGGRNLFNRTFPDPYKYYRLCLEKDDQSAWGVVVRSGWEEVDTTSNLQLAQLTFTFSSAFVSTPKFGLIFGGKEYGPDGQERNVKHYRSFNFETKESREHENPQYTPDSTLWGAGAVFAPDFGDNGFIFFLGGKRLAGEPGSAYLDFETLHFVDPVTLEWYHQKTTFSGKGFPYRRHKHCVAGLHGKNGTYDM